MIIAPLNQLYWIIGALLSIKTVSHSFLYCRTLIRRISRDREKVSLIEFCGDSTEVLNVTDYSTGIPASTAVDVVYTEDVVASAQKTANSGGGAQTRRETQPVFSVIQCSQASLQARSCRVSTARILKLLQIQQQYYNYFH